jgi:hypothetical protein
LPATFKTLLAAFYDEVVLRLGADASIGINAERVSGLSGNVNATTPLTKFDLSAGSVTLRNATINTVVRRNTGTLTCDLGLAGPAANGRDQSGAFTANSWIHLYFIWNGTTLATLASTTAPTSFTGSTLPSGYTHWCYATSIRWNGSSNIVAGMVRGKAFFYRSPVSVLTAGAATALTSVSCATAVPPNALLGKLRVGVAGVWASGNYASVNISAENTGGTIAFSSRMEGGGIAAEGLSPIDFPLSAASAIYYNLVAAPTSGGAEISAYGYVVPNGDV